MPLSVLAPKGYGFGLEPVDPFHSSTTEFSTFPKET
jgi:hypothetical protein